MNFKWLVILLLMISLVYEPTFATAPMIGQVEVKGEAKINGRMAATGASVFAGDQVATGPDAAAAVMLNGDNNVLLPGSSAVVMDSHGSGLVVNLEQGAVAVSSKSGAPTEIKASGVLIKPATAEASTLEVALGANSLRVVARKGSATVEAAGKSVAVSEGKELDATLAPAAAPGTVGVTNSSELKTWVLVAAVGAGVAGLVLGILAIRRPNPRDCSVPSAPKIVCP